jgi:hypothetical protein
MTSLRRILTAATLLLGATGLASANSIIQTFSLGNTNTDITGAVGTGTFNDFLTACPGCQASWLTGVQLSMAVNENLNSLSVTNTASNANTFEYLTYSNVAVVGTAPAADKNLIGFDFFEDEVAFAPSAGGCVASNTPGSINLCDTGNVTFAPGQTIVYSPPVVTAGDSTGGLINASSTTPYDVAGSFTLGFNTQTFQSFVGGGGNGSDSQATQANAVIQVVYDYTIPSGTPEPTTMALMGGALLGLGLIGKRFKKS